MMDIAGPMIDAISDSISQNKQLTYDYYMYRKQEDRANDAMQRRVADFKAAGINPMLAYQGMGGSAASVPQAHPAPAKAPSHFAAGLASAAAAKATMEQVPAIRNKLEAEIHALYQGISVSHEDKILKQIDIEQRRALLPSLVELATNDAYRSRLGLPGHENMSEFEKTWWAQKVVPYIRSIEGLSSAVGGAAIMAGLARSGIRGVTAKGASQGMKVRGMIYHQEY